MNRILTSLIRLVLAACLMTSSHALEIRSYSATRHNRLVHFPGKPVYDFQSPSINPAFSPPANLFLGVAWPTSLTDWTRQLALVSPRHLVHATHYPLAPEWRLAFLGADGKQHSFGIQSQTPVINQQGQPTDLMLCTLTNDVPASSGIHPFPVLNLPDEADYTCREMVVCGSFVRAGKMPVHGFTTLKNDPGFDTTRFAYFDYNTREGADSDCNYQGGDSGAPSFIMTNGQPALVGTASGQDRLPDGISRNYINFLPAYLTELDKLMEVQGYHVRRTHPVDTSVSTRILADGPFHGTSPASLSIICRNTGESTAHNPSMKITFSAPPDRVDGDGWICVTESPLVWYCRRGGLAGSAGSNLTANWNRLPDSKFLKISISWSHDGKPQQTQDTTLKIRQ